jgi:hypothetical protein
VGLEPAEEGKQVKLKRATYRHIEAEIYSYCDTVKVIEELRRDIILANGRQEAYGAVVGGRYADLGAERQRDWVQEYIYRLINERFE